MCVLCCAVMCCCAVQTTLRAILEAARDLKVKLVNMDSCLGDHLDGSYKSRDGTCKDDGCQCTSAAPGLPSTARSVCFKGDLKDLVERFQLVYPDIPDYCKLDVGGADKGVVRDLQPVQHWWKQEDDRYSQDLQAGQSITP